MIFAVFKVPVIACRR